MSELRIEPAGPVRTVVLARSEKRNALTPSMLDGLEGAFRADPPREERVTVLRAEGPVFCAGLDLRERQHGASGESPIEAARRSRDAREGIAARLERRSARFEGC